MPNPQDGDWTRFGCGDEFGLIPAAVGAYSENGPDGAAINPRRVRLIARRRQGLDASHPIRAQGPANRARVHRGSFWRHSTNERWQDEDCGRVTDLKWPKSYSRCRSAIQWTTLILTFLSESVAFVI